MMLDNSTYNKTKILHEASKILWFIEKHALDDAKSAGDQQCVAMLGELQKDLQKHIAHFQKSACSISQ